MKKSIVLMIMVVFTAAVLAFAAEELRPAQKLMQARLAWMTVMKENIEAKKFSAVVEKAEGLAAQTKKVGENLPNPLAKELTLAISALAKDISTAAAMQKVDTVRTKLGEIKGKCDECHAKIRDKK